MKRFSIRSLMAVILVSAVCLAALMGGKDVWTGFMLLIALCSGAYLVVEMRRVA